MMETDQGSETLCSVECLTMVEVLKPSDPECYKTLSETFKIGLIAPIMIYDVYWKYMQTFFVSTVLHGLVQVVLAVPNVSQAEHFTVQTSLLRSTRAEFPCHSFGYAAHLVFVSISHDSSHWIYSSALGDK
jgi:hypothetical protein